jgi:hypothetical protein
MVEIEKALVTITVAAVDEYEEPPALSTTLTQ